MWHGAPGGDAWEPCAEPTEETWARASQPPGHRDRLPGPHDCNRTGASAHGARLGGGSRSFLTNLRVVLPVMAESHTPTAWASTRQSKGFQGTLSASLPCRLTWESSQVAAL